MVKSSQTFHSIFIFALICVNLIISEMPLVEAATCFKVLTDVTCNDGRDVTCQAPCKKRCGASAGAQCIDQPFLGLICACSFTAPDCQSQHVC